MRRSRPATAAASAVLACACALSARAAPDCRSARFPILNPSLASTPYIVLDAGGRRGPWLVDFGSTISSVFSGSWGAPGPGEPVPVFRFGLAGRPAEPRTLPFVEGGQHRSGVGSPLGTLGTDVLRTVTTEIHYEDPSDPHVIFSDPSCGRHPPEPDRSARFGQAGFFGPHPEANAAGLPNVPVVSLELEERPTDRERPRLSDPKRSPRVWAQVDTGYADTYWPYSVDINEPYLAQLKEAVPSLTLTGLVPVSGCGREDTLREVYVAPGWRLAIVPDPPRRTIPFEGFHLVVKPRATACGGIGPMAAPAAQLGASFLRAFGTTLIDPARAEVWITPPGR